MSNDDMQLGAEEEYDLGTPTPDQDVTVKVTGVEKVAAGSNGGVRLEIEFSGEDLPATLKVREWIEHPNATAKKIGQGKLRQIFKAATGSDNFSKSAILGSFVNAKLGEDDNGFLRLRNFRPAVSQVPSIG